MTTLDKKGISEDPRIDDVRNEVDSALSQSPKNVLKTHYMQVFEEEAKNPDSIPGKVQMIIAFMVGNRNEKAVRDFAAEHNGFNSVLNRCEENSISEALVKAWLPNQERITFLDYLKAIYEKANNNSELVLLSKKIKAESKSEKDSDSDKEKNSETFLTIKMDLDEINNLNLRELQELIAHLEKIKINIEKSGSGSENTGKVSAAMIDRDLKLANELYENLAAGKSEEPAEEPAEETKKAPETPSEFQTIKFKKELSELTEEQLSNIIIPKLQSNLSELGDSEGEQAEKIFADLALAKELLAKLTGEESTPTPTLSPEEDEAEEENPETIEPDEDDEEELRADDAIVESRSAEFQTVKLPEKMKDISLEELTREQLGKITAVLNRKLTEAKTNEDKADIIADLNLAKHLISNLSA